MFDDLQPLLDNQLLLKLLAHYAEAAGEDREAWQDRVMEMDGARPEDLVRWHGLLLAGEWIEQNTGVTPVLQRGAVRSCYRVTRAGRRALEGSRVERTEAEEVVTAE
jgi:hypothetical protein